jgi:hypothetical protein
MFLWYKNRYLLGEIESILCFYYFRSQVLIKDAILANEFLTQLDPSQLEAIVQAMYPEEYEANSNVVTQGETGLLFKLRPL